MEGHCRPEGSLTGFRSFGQESGRKQLGRRGGSPHPIGRSASFWGPLTLSPKRLLGGRDPERAPSKASGQCLPGCLDRLAPETLPDGRRGAYPSPPWLFFSRVALLLLFLKPLLAFLFYGVSINLPSCIPTLQFRILALTFKKGFQEELEPVFLWSRAKPETLRSQAPDFRAEGGSGRRRFCLRTPAWPCSAWLSRRAGRAKQGTKIPSIPVLPWKKNELIGSFPILVNPKAQGDHLQQPLPKTLHRLFK